MLCRHRKSLVHYSRNTPPPGRYSESLRLSSSLMPDTRPARRHNHSPMSPPAKMRKPKKSKYSVGLWARPDTFSTQRRANPAITISPPTTMQMLQPLPACPAAGASTGPPHPGHFFEPGEMALPQAGHSARGLPLLLAPGSSALFLPAIPLSIPYGSGRRSPRGSAAKAGTARAYLISSSSTSKISASLALIAPPGLGRSP